MAPSYETFAESTPTPGIMSSSGPLGTSSRNSNGGPPSRSPGRRAGVQLRESARSLPVEVVGDLGVDHRAEQEREVMVLG